MMYPAGIWAVPDGESTGGSHTKDATRYTSLLTTDLSSSAKPSAPPGTQTSIYQRAPPIYTISQDVITSSEPLPNATLELVRVQSRAEGITTGRSSNAGLAQEHGSPRLPISQGVPPEFPNLLAEVVFILTCTGGQLTFALLIGHVTVTQNVFRDALGIPASQMPWLTGAFMLASGLSVVISGSLADLAPPKPLMVGAFLWEVVWSIVAAAAAISPRLKVLFFIARAMQGLAVGVLVSASMSILGRVYSPGLRKTRVFSLMAAGAPFGYWLGCVQAGALSSHLPWIFYSTAVFLAVCVLAALITIPPIRPASDSINTEAPSLRQFDYVGAGLASVGCSLIIFGLTQGSSAHWNPYTYCSIILGFLMLVAFYFVEQRITRPLIPNRLWQTPGFGILLVSYFLGLGAYSESFDTPNTYIYISIKYPHKYSNIVLIILFTHNRLMAILFHPVLATLPKRDTVNRSHLPPSQWHRRRPRGLHRLQDLTRPAHPRDSLGQHARLRSRHRLLPPADANVQLLGTLHAGCRPLDVWARHEFCGRVHLHHEQRAEELPGRGGESVSDSTEPQHGGHDQSRRGDRDEG